MKNWINLSYPTTSYTLNKETKTEWLRKKNINLKEKSNKEGKKNIRGRNDSNKLWRVYRHATHAWDYDDF
jgi:hypothetical protein